MRPGGLCGLQLRWQQSYDWCGGFDSLALPPIFCLVVGNDRLGEFLELFRRIQSELNKTTSSLATLAMLVSTLEYPELDVSEELQSFDELKTVLSRRIPYDSTLLEQLNEISEYLFSELGFTGNVQNY